MRVDNVSFKMSSWLVMSLLDHSFFSDGPSLWGFLVIYFDYSVRECRLSEGSVTGCWGFREVSPKPSVTGICFFYIIKYKNTFSLSMTEVTFRLLKILNEIVNSRILWVYIILLRKKKFHSDKGLTNNTTMLWN